MYVLSLSLSLFLSFSLSYTRARKYAQQQERRHSCPEVVGTVQINVGVVVVIVKKAREIQNRGGF